MLKKYAALTQAIKAHDATVNESSRKEFGWKVPKIPSGATDTCYFGNGVCARGANSTI